MEATNESSPADLTITVLLDKRQLYLWKVSDAPVELEFQKKYGTIVAYQWFSPQRIMLAFASGYFVLISTDMREIGQEMFQGRNHTRLASAACCLALNQAATCGEDTIKFRDLTDRNEAFGVIRLEEENGRLDSLEWSQDGQMLSVSSQLGAVYTFLCKIPSVGAAWGVRGCYLSALDELTAGPVDASEASIKIPTKGVQPTFVGCGQDHVAFGANNLAFFYLLPEPNSGKPAEPMSPQPRSYLSSVQQLRLNVDYAAALCDGKVELHWIEAPEDKAQPESILLPPKGAAAITCMDLTTSFCIYGDAMGGLTYFILEDWKVLSQFKHVIGIRKVFSDPTGARLCFTDDKGDAFLYTPSNDALYEIPGAVVSADTLVLWDNRPNDQGTFVLVNSETITTYVFSANFYTGGKVSQVGTSPRDPSLAPLVLLNGTLHAISTTGRLSQQLLTTHDAMSSLSSQERDPKRAAEQLIALGRFREALVPANIAQDSATWLSLCHQSIQHLEIDTAIHGHRACGKVAMVHTLVGIQYVEDRNLLCGHVCLLQRDVDKAQEFFLASSRPVEALTMHRDLLNWEKALSLAARFAPEELPYVSREYAHQLEITGKYAQALKMFEQGVTDKTADAHHNQLCQMGIARTVLRTGDFRRGTQLAQELNDKALFRECAALLDQMNQFADSAVMYEAAGQPDKAASMYIKMKNWSKVAALLPTISSPKLVAQYARAREADGSYKEAADAYEQAKDYDNLIRVSLQHLREPDRAVQAVKLTGSVEGAKLVANFFLGLGDHSSAIQFLVLSNQSGEAFKLAQQHGKMDLYAKYVGSGASTDDFGSVALVFEKEGNFLDAGRFFIKAGQHAKGVKLLLKCADAGGNEPLDLAIEAVGQANDAELTREVMAYLMGDEMTEPKEPKYLFRLYMALKQYSEAARTALIIAKGEREAGNYRNAHDLLLSMYRQLQQESICIPQEMAQDLLLLHSYILVKAHVKRGDHLRGARMLIRVANSISQFPAHIVNILTSTVIECHRSGLKNSSFKLVSQSSFSFFSLSFLFFPPLCLSFTAVMSCKRRHQRQAS